MGAGRGKTGSANLSARKDREEYTEQDFGIPSDSYIYDKEFLDMEEEYNGVQNEIDKVIDELKVTPKEKPREEWTWEDEMDVEEMSWYRPETDAYRRLSDKRDKLEKSLRSIGERQDTYHSLHNNSKVYSDIPISPYNGKSRYFDMRGINSNNEFGSTAELLKYYSNGGKQAKIVSMSPKEYIERCASQIFNSSYEQTLIGRVRNRKDTIIGYSKAMKKGSKAPMPYLDYSTKNQEGIHRALASMIAGETSIPVLVIS